MVDVVAAAAATVEDLQTITVEPGVGEEIPGANLPGALGSNLFVQPPAYALPPLPPPSDDHDPIG